MLKKERKERIWYNLSFLFISKWKSYFQNFVSYVNKKIYIKKRHCNCNKMEFDSIKCGKIQNENFINSWLQSFLILFIVNKMNKNLLLGVALLVMTVTCIKL